MVDSLTATDWETAKAIHRLTTGGGPARTGDLATELAVVPASVTARVQRLAERGAVTYTPYQGAELTAQGRELGAAAMRRHRILERFLCDVLGYPWQEADSVANQFEHALPGDVVTRMFDALDRPSTCPHGFPIPAADAVEVPVLPTLDQVEPGVEATVALEGSMDDDVRAFLDDIGVRPGASIVVREQHPFAGPVIVTVEGRQRTIGNRVARQVFVRPRQTAVRPRDDSVDQ